MIMLEPVNELPGKFMLLFRILYLITDWSIDFQNEGYHDIEHDKCANNPKGREVKPRPIRPSDDTVHVGRLVPIIDDQDMEKSHHAGVKVVKIDQEVHIWGRYLVDLDGFGRDDCRKKVLAYHRVEEHDWVEREHASHERRGESLERLCDLSEVLQLPEETEQAEVSQEQYDWHQPRNFNLCIVVEWNVHDCDHLHGNLEDKLCEVFCLFHDPLKSKNYHMEYKVNQEDGIHNERKYDPKPTVL